ncbi:Uma2 family endonuclease [Streptomyces sp. NPDC051582]|uniref:Uma2 family endonuclease n=1 Tax=Streptomyces sp. NPDC051582 TaxID=3155167 RepID=UPI0034389E52
MIIEVVSPGHENIARDRTRKRREYAHAGVPVYVLIDDYDAGGTVTVLSAPDPERAVHEDEMRASYGTGATIPSGPAKGFTIGADITRSGGAG